MTSFVMSSMIDGSIAALGICAAVIMLIAALVTSESRPVAKVESLQALPRKLAQRAA